MSKPRGMLAGLMAVGLIGFSGVAMAVNQGDTTTVLVRGTLLDPPDCTFFGTDDRVQVDFGNEIITHKINEGSYVEQIPYALTCSNLAQQGLKITLKGQPASFNNHFFSTSNPRLGILIFTERAKEIDPNSEIAFTYGEQPRLFASLFDDHSATPLAGYFTGSATMVVAYQ